MGGLTRLFILIGMMWALQLYLAWRQAATFQKDMKSLRQHAPNVAIGVGGRRYRGGRAYVALAADNEGIVRNALVLSGLSIFARAKAIGDYTGFSIEDIITGQRAMVSRPTKVIEAAKTAAEHIRSHLRGDATGE